MSKRGKKIGDQLVLPFESDDGNRQPNILNELLPVEQEIKSAVLIERERYNSDKVQRLIKNWKFIYELNTKVLLTEDVWQDTNIFKWLMYHQLFDDLQNSKDLD